MNVIQGVNAQQAPPSRSSIALKSRGYQKPSNDTLPLVHQKKRHMPIANKKKVFNEWGAVMLH